MRRDYNPENRMTGFESELSERVSGLTAMYDQARALE